MAEGHRDDDGVGGGLCDWGETGQGPFLTISWRGKSQGSRSVSDRRCVDLVAFVNGESGMACCLSVTFVKMVGEFNEPLAGTSALHVAELMDSMHQITVSRRKTEPSGTARKRQHKQHNVYYGEAVLPIKQRARHTKSLRCLLCSLVAVSGPDQLHCKYHPNTRG